METRSSFNIPYTPPLHKQIIRTTSTYTPALKMSIVKVEKLIDDLERKANKAIKIVQKGDKLSYGDAIKLGRKSNSMISTVKKGIKEYDVSYWPPPSPGGCCSAFARI